MVLSSGPLVGLVVKWRIERGPLVVIQPNEPVASESVVISTSQKKSVHSWVLGGYYLNGNAHSQIPIH